MASRAYLKKAASGLLVLFAIVALPVMAANIYRYVDKQGRMVWDSKIPAEFVKDGYTILNERGQVIEVVPRALTREEIAQQESVLVAQQQEEESARAQLEADKLLLRLFRSPEDIERKRDEKIEQLDVQRIVLMAALSKTEQEIKRLDVIVANNEKAGKTPAADVQESLKFQHNEKLRLDNLLAKLDGEAQQARSDAQRDISRLRELLGLAEE